MNSRLVQVAMATLMLTACVQGGFALLLGPGVALGAGLDPLRPGLAQGLRVGIVWLVWCVAALGISVSALLAAAGLWLRQPWGWWLAVVVSLAQLPTGCLPLGVVGLWALSQQEVREAVLKAKAPRTP